MKAYGPKCQPLIKNILLLQLHIAKNIRGDRSIRKYVSELLLLPFGHTSTACQLPSLVPLSHHFCDLPCDWKLLRNHSPKLYFATCPVELGSFTALWLCTQMRNLYMQYGWFLRLSGSWGCPSRLINQPALRAQVPTD